MIYVHASAKSNKEKRLTPKSNASSVSYKKKKSEIKYKDGNELFGLPCTNIELSIWPITNLDTHEKTIGPTRKAA